MRQTPGGEESLIITELSVLQRNFQYCRNLEHNGILSLIIRGEKKTAWDLNKAKLLSCFLGGNLECLDRRSISEFLSKKIILAVLIERK